MNKDSRLEVFRAEQARHLYCARPRPCDEHKRGSFSKEKTVADEQVCGTRIHLDDELLANLKAKLPELEKLLLDVSNETEDRVYRFYHQSFKVYYLQEETKRIVTALTELLPTSLRELRSKSNPLNKWFTQIISEGTGKQFEHAHNQRWLEETRPIVEAFFHAKYFLEMGVQFGKELKEAPQMLPSGWAAFLYLYDMR